MTEALATAAVGEPERSRDTLQARLRGRYVAEERELVRAALARSRQSIREAKMRLKARPNDARLHLRIATIELHRAYYLALLDYDPQSLDEEYPRWLANYLIQDPQGTISRAAWAARAAAVADGTREVRRDALLTLATACAARGDTTGEAEALAEATRLEPHRAQIWLRLAGAYGRARRFARADAAFAQAERLMVGQGIAGSR
jgi:hypothetical protein